MFKTGIIEQTAVKTGDTGKRKWEKTAALVNEVWYQTFDKSLGLQLVALEGENVSIEYEEQERNGFINLNVLSVRRSERAPETPVSPSNDTQPVREGISHKDAQIARSVALKAAVQAVGLIDLENPDLNEYAQKVGRIADMFYGWLVNSPQPTEEEIEFGLNAELDSTGLPKGF